MITEIDWEEIKKTALLGTDRRPLSPVLMAQAQALGIDTEAAPEKILASLILAANVLLKTARVLPQSTLENKVPATAVQLIPCPTAIANLLPRILKNNWPEVLQEFTEVLQSRGWRFPAQFIPALLDRAIEEPTFWKKIKPLIEGQAEWLIQQNPNWRELQIGITKNNQTYSPQVFERERSVDVKIANAHLLGQWTTLKKIKKLQFLLVFEKNLHLDDESFLQAIWGDKNKDIQAKIFDLNLSITDSEISKVRSAFLEKLIDKKKNISLPELSAVEKKQLQLLARHSDFKGGLKANLLAQILAGTSWNTWVTELALTYDNFTTWIEKQEWKEQILQALFHVVARENNTALRTLLFKYFHQHPDDLPEATALLFKNMSAEQFGQLSHWSFEQGLTILNEENIYIIMALNFDSAWPKHATFGYFKIVKTWLRKNPRFRDGKFIWQIIKRLAFRADPKDLPLMQRAFQQDMIWSLAEEELNKFLSILKFRQQLYID